MAHSLKNDQYIWFNGSLMHINDANIHVLTHSLHYAGAVFEGERSYNGKIFKLEEHTDRLLKSAAGLYLKCHFSAEEINKANQEVVDANKLQDAYIRPLIWRGSESLGISPNNLSFNVMIYGVESPHEMRNGLNVILSKWSKPQPSSMPPQCKSSGHYTTMIIALEEAKILGYDDAMLLDHRGYIAECTTSNLFFVQGDSLITPIADVFLNGITRQTVIAMALGLGIKIVEARITTNDLDKYDEAFMVGTAAEIKGIGMIDLNDRKIIFNNTRITKILQGTYFNLVRK